MIVWLNKRIAQCQFRTRPPSEVRARSRALRFRPRHRRVTPAGQTLHIEAQDRPQHWAEFEEPVTWRPDPHVLGDGSKRRASGWAGLNRRPRGRCRRRDARHGARPCVGPAEGLTPHNRQATPPLPTLIQPDVRPRVFISYARSDGEAFALALRQRLEAEGIALWRDREGMEGGRDWWLQITEAIDQVEFLVLVATAAALASALVRREWRYARQRGVTVYPVLADDRVDFDRLPRWMRSAHFYDLAHEWRKFTQDLHTTPQTLRVPFMAEDLPDDFVPRPREFDQLLALLVDRQREEPIAATTALRGAGGFGKTALARAVCHDPAIQNAFDDGILWVTLGEKPGDLTGRVEDLIFMLSGQRPGFTGLETAVATLVELLADRELLIVIDDAWHAAHVRPFLQGGERCARVITTRSVDTLPASARRVDVDAMTNDEAATLLAQGLPACDGCAPLAARLGEWPLLLTLVNGALRERVLHQGQALADALAYVHKALDKRGLTFFDARDAGARHAAVATTLGLSLAQLSAHEGQRFDELAVFPEDAEIPLATLAALWAHSAGLDDLDCEALCERLARLSLLLRLDLSQRVVRMHDVVRRFLLERLGAQAPALHRTLVAAGRPGSGAWSDLASREPYWWHHLFFHLRAAGLDDELRATALDLRYLSRKAVVRTAFSVESDLRLAESSFPDEPAWSDLRRSFSQTAHLFGDCGSADEVRATWFARLDPQSPLGRAAAAVREPRIVALAPLPDLPHPALVRTLGDRRGAMRACAISADGRLFATAAEEGGVTVWDAPTASPLRHLGGELLPDDHCAVRTLDLSDDGQLLAVATADRRIWVWNTGSGALVARLQGHSDVVTDCALSRDGRWLLSASSDETVKLWDVATASLQRTLVRTAQASGAGTAAPAEGQADRATPGGGTGHSAAVLGCAISADGRLALSASADQTVVVWDLSDGRPLQVLRGHAAAVNACAFSSDGRWVAAGGSDGTLRLWDLASGEQRAVAAHRQAVTACAFAADGKHLVSASADGTVRVWSGDAELLRTLVGHGDGVHDCAVSAAAGWVVSAGNDGTARIWQLSGHADPYRQRGHDGPAQCCAADPHGRYAVSGGQDQTLVLWDIRHAQARRWWHADLGSVRACAMRPVGGGLLAVAGADRGVVLWDITEGRRVETLAGHRDSVNRCAFHPGGGILATVANDRTVRLWDLNTRARRLAWVAHAAPVNACAFSPDGRWLVTGASDGTLTRWSMAIADPLWEAWLTDARPLPAQRAAAELSALAVAQHAASVTDCVFIGGGSLVASASGDRTIKVWDCAAATLLHTLEGHLESVEGLAVDPGGRWLASVSAEGGLRVWSLADWRCAMALHVDGPLRACAWVGGQGRLVAVGSRGVYLLACVNAAACG